MMTFLRFLLVAAVLGAVWTVLSVVTVAVWVVLRRFGLVNIETKR